MFFDPLYLLFMIPGLVIAGFATFYTKSTFEQYSHERASSGMTGAEAAARLLSGSGIRDVRIEETSGFLSDHYDPSCKTLRLSHDVYAGDSLSSIGVACHEAGHALQHAAAYGPLALRSGLVPLTNISSMLSYPILLFGFIFGIQPLLIVGIVLFSMTVIFALVTLPVEWDASSRAKKLMVSCGIVTERERDGAGSVLNAAFLTYVASAVSALLILLYYIIRSRR